MDVRQRHYNNCQQTSAQQLLTCRYALLLLLLLLIILLPRAGSGNVQPAACPAAALWCTQQATGGAACSAWETGPVCRSIGRRHTQLPTRAGAAGIRGCNATGLYLEPWLCAHASLCSTGQLQLRHSGQPADNNGHARRPALHHAASRLRAAAAASGTAALAAAAATISGALPGHANSAVRHSCAAVSCGRAGCRLSASRAAAAAGLLVWSAAAAAATAILCANRQLRPGADAGCWRHTGVSPLGSIRWCRRVCAAAATAGTAAPAAGTRHVVCAASRADVPADVTRWSWSWGRACWQQHPVTRQRTAWRERA